MCQRHRFCQRFCEESHALLRKVFGGVVPANFGFIYEHDSFGQPDGLDML